MELIFIHGINNQNRLPSDIKDVWWNSLVEGWQQNGYVNIPDKPTIKVGYYARRLYFATNGLPLPELNDVNGELPPLNTDEMLDIVTQGFGEQPSSYGGPLLEEFAAAYDIDIKQEGDLTEMGWFRRNLVKIISAMEQKLPAGFSKELAGHFLGQASVYADSIGLRAGIENQVIRQISGQPFDDGKSTKPLDSAQRIFVTHSLGTVVGYRLIMSELARGAKIPLFVTLGSPLALKFIKLSLDQGRRSFPTPPVDRWVNAWDREDFVTTGRSLTKNRIGFTGVENYELNEGDFKSGEGKHNSGAHLRQKNVSEAIFKALNGAS